MEIHRGGWKSIRGVVFPNPPYGFPKALFWISIGRVCVPNPGGLFWGSGKPLSTAHKLPCDGSFMELFLGSFGVISVSFLWSLWCHFGIIFGVILKSFWDHFWFRSHIGFILLPFWIIFGVVFGVVLGSFCCHFGVILRLFFGDIFGVIWMSFGGHIGVILVLFLTHFGVTPKMTSKWHQNDTKNDPKMTPKMTT